MKQPSYFIAFEHQENNSPSEKLKAIPREFLHLYKCRLTTFYLNLDVETVDPVFYD